MGLAGPELSSLRQSPVQLGTCTLTTKLTAAFNHLHKRGRKQKGREKQEEIQGNSHNEELESGLKA